MASDTMYYVRLVTENFEGCTDTLVRMRDIVVRAAKRGPVSPVGRHRATGDGALVPTGGLGILSVPGPQSCARHSSAAPGCGC